MIISDRVVKFETNSLSDVCGESKQAAIYGWTHCHYGSLKLLYLNKLEEKIRSKIDFPFDLLINGIECNNLEGRKLERVNSYDNPLLKEHWKEILTNIVLENCKRSRMDLALIPVVFLIDVDNNLFPTTPKTLLSRDSFQRGLVTNAELRRSYKLCQKMDDLTIASVAKKTFKFVKWVEGDDKICRLEKVLPPWNNIGWEEEWNGRVLTKEVKNESKKLDWKKIFHEKLTAFVPINDLLANSNKDEICSLISRGVIAYDDLSESWQIDEDVAEAALSVSDGEIMQSLDVDTIISLCNKNPTYIRFLYSWQAKEIKESLPLIDWNAPDLLNLPLPHWLV